MGDARVCMTDVRAMAAPRQSSKGMTRRRAEVLEFRRRLSLRDTATAMGIAVPTVKTLQREACEALGAETLADAVAMLAERRAA